MMAGAMGPDGTRLCGIDGIVEDGEDNIESRWRGDAHDVFRFTLRV